MNNNKKQKRNKTEKQNYPRQEGEKKGRHTCLGGCQVLPRKEHPRRNLKLGANRLLLRVSAVYRFPSLAVRASIVRGRMRGGVGAVLYNPQDNTPPQGGNSEPILQSMGGMAALEKSCRDLSTHSSLGTRSCHRRVARRLHSPHSGENQSAFACEDVCYLGVF